MGFLLRFGMLALTSMLPMAAQSSQAESPQELMIQDLQAAKNTIAVKYAPTEWKHELLGWDLLTSYNIARDRIVNEMPASDKEYQKIFRQFIQSTQDYHVRTTFYSTEFSWFPIDMLKIGDRYFIQSNEGSELVLHDEEIHFNFDELDFSKYAEAFPIIQRGDEILTVDGQPIGALIEKLIDEDLNGDRSSTGYSLACKSMFLRKGKYGQIAPKGEFEITILHVGDDSPTTYILPWIHVSEWVDEQVFKEVATPKAIKQTAVEKISSLISQSLSKDYSVGFAKDMIHADIKTALKQSQKGLLSIKNNNRSDFEDDDEDGDEDFDYREKGFLPPIGKVIWETSQDNDIYAYLAENDSGQRIGYIYLSTFGHAGSSADSILDEIIAILTLFENESAALVFDITNNPGGNLYFMYGVLSTLSNYPLIAPTQQEKLIQQDIYSNAAVYNAIMDSLKEAENEMEYNGEEDHIPTLSGYPFTREVMLQFVSHLQFTIQSWKEGKLLTDPFPLSGINEIIPHYKVNYTKPIILLVNELDFSCADFFPAILQDNNRATIFGKRTAGAGGYVKGYSHNSQFGVQGFSLTGSIAYRVNGAPIENLGVTPDVPCEITIRDLQENYVDYIEKLNKVIDSKL